MTRLTITLLTLTLAACNQRNGNPQSPSTPKSPTQTPGPAGAKAASATSSTFRPHNRPFSHDHPNNLKLPHGFSISVYAQDLGRPRMLATGPDGTIYVTRRQPGDVLALPDKNNDGKADSAKPLFQLPG